MRKLGEQWIEVIEGERHLVMEVKSDKEHAACPRCMFNGGHGTCVYPEDDCPVRNGHYIKDLGILNENGCLPCPLCGGYPRLAMTGRRKEMTREHRAWEMLIRRLNYLNSFGGNRSEMEKTTRIVAEIWDDTGHEEEPVTTLPDGWEEKCSHSI